LTVNNSRHTAMADMADMADMAYELIDMLENYGA
jgi:hypothetical protein